MFCRDGDMLCLKLSHDHFSSETWQTYHRLRYIDIDLGFDRTKNSLESCQYGVWCEKSHDAFWCKGPIFPLWILKVSELWDI